MPFGFPADSPADSPGDSPGDFPGCFLEYCLGYSQTVLASVFQLVYLNMKEVYKYSMAETDGDN